MKRYAIGDIHGRVEALKEVLKKSKFNYKDDKLIILGDIADGGYNTAQVIDELLKIKNCILVLGNHDEWFMNHIASGWSEEIWIQQGGANTLKSYGAKIKESDYITDRSFIDARDLMIPVTHQDFLNRGKYYHIEDDMLFVHGGFLWEKGIENTPKEVILWDRDLINHTRESFGDIKPYKKIFIGHTSTQLIDNTMDPIKYNNLICLDTGAGWTGKLTIMDIDTEKFWQSKTQKPAI